MKINVSPGKGYDASPQSFKDCLTYVIDYFGNFMISSIDVNFEFTFDVTDWSGKAFGNAAANAAPYIDTLSYEQVAEYLSQYRPEQQTISIPGFESQTQIIVSTAQEKAWGWRAADNNVDAIVSVNSIIPWSYTPGTVPPKQFDLVAALQHEISHGLGRYCGLSQNPPAFTSFDLYRFAPSKYFNDPPHWSFSASENAYFSIDLGKSGSRWFNSTTLVTSGGVDFADWYSQIDPSPGSATLIDPFAEANSGIVTPMTQIDAIVMSSLGYMVLYIPVVDVSVPVGKAIPLTQLFYSPGIVFPRGHGISRYRFTILDVGGNGYIAVDGNAQPPGIPVYVPGDSFDRYSYVGGSSSQRIAVAFLDDTTQVWSPDSVCTASSTLTRVHGGPSVPLLSPSVPRTLGQRE